MRSPREISFRLKQEFRNVQLAFLPPSCRPNAAAPLSSFPAPSMIATQLKDTPFAAELLQTADHILGHRLPLLGYTLDTGPQIDWRRDYLNSRNTEASYFRLVPYLDVSKAGDHKNIWELNRHQHLVLLAQAYLFTEQDRFLHEIFEQLNTWWQQNPYQRGINWTSALEVAFRAFSWIWVFHFIGDKMTSQFRHRFLTSLCQHAHHLANNLSFYFSPNTHLLGEAVVLHAIGKLFPSFPRAEHWVQLGRKTVAEEMNRQVRADGGHFEQSTYYHVYALDMFLFHAILTDVSAEYRSSLGRMGDLLQALLGPARKLPFLGDDDGGRWFHPFGKRDEFGRATLATCSAVLQRTDWTYQTEDLYPQAAWFLGQTRGSASGSLRSQSFPDTGLAILQDEHSQVIFDVGSFGPGRSGHSHSDALSIVATHGKQEILVDSGTYTYVGDPVLRNVFRGTAAHNTIRINGRDQALPTGPFWWSNPAEVRLLSCSLNAEDTVVGLCKYEDFLHLRLLQFRKPNLVLILDRVEGPPGEHELEQFWHLGSPDAKNQLTFGSEFEEQRVEHSLVFAKKQTALCLVVKKRMQLPAVFATALTLDGQSRFRIEEQPDKAVYRGVVNGREERIEIAFPAVAG